MSFSQKLLLSIPSVLGILYLITLWFPTKFGWLYPTMTLYNIQMIVLSVLVILQLIILIRKLWSFKNIEKSTKTNWTLLLIFFAQISAWVFIWKKIDEFEGKND